MVIQPSVMDSFTLQAVVFSSVFKGTFENANNYGAKWALWYFSPECGMTYAGEMA